MTNICGTTGTARKLPPLRFGGRLSLGLLLALGSGEAVAQTPLRMPPALELSKPLAPEPILDESSGKVWTIDSAVGTAIANSPTLAEAQARVAAACGRRTQAALPPNPTAGYLGTEIGNEGQAGQQGLYVGQTFVRGNKLGLAAAMESREALRLQQLVEAQRLRVTSRTRAAYYDTAIAQRQLDLVTQLVQLSDESLATTNKLLEAREAQRSELLLATITRDQTIAQRAQAQAKLDGAWRRLAAEMNVTDLPFARLSLDAAQLDWATSWDDTLAHLLSGSPELTAADFAIERARCAWRRACAEPVPDIDTQIAAQYDYATEYAIATVQVGGAVPIRNRNQGGIAAALAEYRAALHSRAALEQQLRAELASAYQQYESSHALLLAQKEQILPAAQQNFDLVQQAYAGGEATYLMLLTAQRTYSEASFDYLTSLANLNQSIRRLESQLTTRDE